MNNGGQYTVIVLANIISYGGADQPAPSLHTTITTDRKILPLHPQTEFVQPFEIAVDIMRKADVFGEDEDIILYEAGSIAINHGGGRGGVLVLTNRRIICLGDHLSGDMIYFDDHEQRPYVWSLTSLDIKKLREISEKKNSIEARYNTKYIQSRKIPIYHPLFQFDLQLKPKLKEGTVKIIIDMTSLGTNKKEIKADYVQRKHEFYSRIIQMYS